MKVSFILSADEVFTLASLTSEHTEAGRYFLDEVLTGAEICDLTGLVEKKLARQVGGEIELSPVLRMVAGALSRADSAARHGEAWEVRSPWVTLLCEKYIYRDKHFKITPVESK